MYFDKHPYGCGWLYRCTPCKYAVTTHSMDLLDISDCHSSVARDRTLGVDFGCKTVELADHRIRLQMVSGEWLDNR